jgi:hypothetical protein
VKHRAELYVGVDNLHSCIEALGSLREARDRLVQMVASYPVVCSFGRIQRVLSSASDVDDLIIELDTKIQAFGERRRTTSGGTAPLAVVP